MKKTDQPGGPAVSTGKWTERSRPVYRAFPGPSGADVPLRVTMTRAAFAEITAHAKDSLDAEVCGILAGETCEDDEGLFIDVKAVVRGTSTRHGRGHVTFTQETWNDVHSALERDHAGLSIVGWYHSHPGFGVEFSDMDVFIQKHFFPLESQIALVMDPLGGEVALGCIGASGMQYLPLFWVEGREHRARRPVPRNDAPAGAAALEALETRVNQLVAAVDGLRAGIHRFLLFTGTAVALALALIVAYSIYRSFFTSVRPPEALSFVPVPVQIDGKPALIGVGVVKWDIPRELLVMPGSEAESGGELPAPSETRSSSPEKHRVDR